MTDVVIATISLEVLFHTQLLLIIIQSYMFYMDGLNVEAV